MVASNIELIRWLIYLNVFYLFLTEYDQFLPLIINSFQQAGTYLGGQAGGTYIVPTPAGIIGNGFDIALQITHIAFKRTLFLNISMALISVSVIVVILYCFGRIAIELLLIQIGSQIILAGLFNLGKLISSRRKAAVKGANIVQPQPVEIKKQRSKISGVSEKAQASLTQKEVSGVRLAIIAKENCMVTLKVDGKTFFQGVLMKGRSESWRAKEKMELSLSNAGAVELIVNSQHFSNIGKRKQKLNNILINKEGLHIGR